MLHSLVPRRSTSKREIWTTLQKNWSIATIESPARRVRRCLRTPNWPWKARGQMGPRLGRYPRRGTPTSGQVRKARGWGDGGSRWPFLVVVL